MTSITLLQWILGALLLQLAAFMGLAFGRHWQAYAALREAAAKGQFELPLPAGTVAANPAAAAWAGYRSFRVRAKTLEDADGQVCSFELVPEDGQPLAPFLPGQFLTFRLDLPSTQGSTSRVVRCYSLSDAPKAEAYRVSIKRALNGTGVTGVNQHATHYFHDDVKVGSLLQARASQPASILALPERVHHHHGRIDLRLLRSVLPLKPYHFYLCGPTQLLASLVPALESWGVVDERIHFEAFGPASIPRKKAGLTPSGPVTGSPFIGPLAVTFATSGKVCEWWPGMGSLLDFAEANGIDVASGCRSGSCGSCQTTIRAGQVRYAHAPDHTPEPGTCLLCVSTPVSAVTLDA